MFRGSQTADAEVQSVQSVWFGLLVCISGRPIYRPTDISDRCYLIVRILANADVGTHKADIFFIECDMSCCRGLHGCGVS